MIPQNSPPCYHSSMRHLVVLFIHFIATLARPLGAGGVRSLVAESLLLKHQLLILNRSRQRSPKLSACLVSHLYDQLLQLGRNSRSSSGFRFPPPKQPKAFPMPSDEGVRLD